MKMVHGQNQLVMRMLATNSMVGINSSLFSGIHLAMQLNARDFGDGYDLNRWLNKAIFPTEARLNPEYVRIRTAAAVVGRRHWM